MTAKKIGGVEYVGFSADEIRKAAGLRDDTRKPKVSPAEAIAKANAAIDASRAIRKRRAAMMDAMGDAVTKLDNLLHKRVADARAKMDARLAKSRAEMEDGFKKLRAHFAEQDRQIEAERKARFPGWD